MFGVPVNDEIFNETNKAQWLWYYYNVVEDNDNDFIKNRDLVEYQVSFFEPKIVKEIVEKRKSEEPNKQFENSVKEMFGRDIGSPTNKIQSNMNNLEDVKNMLNSADLISSQTRKTKDPTAYNFDHWLNFKLR